MPVNFSFFTCEVNTIIYPGLQMNKLTKVKKNGSIV